MLHNKKLEIPATDKYSSLFHPFVSNEEKKCCEYGPKYNIHNTSFSYNFQMNTIKQSVISQ
jgi:hypothetical protein